MEEICPSNTFTFMELLPILMDNIDTKEEIILLPSQLNHELEMSAEERLTRLSKPTRKYRIHTDMNTFARTPDIIVFQNFVPGVVYKTTMSFLNIHPVSRHIRLISGNTPNFEIYGPTNDSSAKLAPGMTFIINVSFFPTELRDYLHFITVISDIETFKVPIYGLSAQAILTLPDHIKLSPTAINIASEKNIILHNSGKIAASFIITSKSPFAITPYKYHLAADHFVELIIYCKATTLGLHKDCLNFCYNEIKFKIYVECEVYTANISIEKDSILFQDIYMGLKKYNSLKVFNHSSHHINFKWRLYKSLAIDQLENSKLIKKLEGIRELEKKRCNKLEKMNIIDQEGHSQIYDTLFENEVANIENNDLNLYHNVAFEIRPMKGMIFPNNSQEFIVTFKPVKSEHYESWAYLDVTGRDDRLSLKLSGTGKGPYVLLNVRVINTGPIFLCAVHNYEVALRNAGNIPATVRYKHCISNFATIGCIPRKLVLPYQDSCGAFIISFYSELKGKFIETIEFVIKESGEIVHVVLTGNVVCPVLKLHIPGLDFGNFPFGTTEMRDFYLVNDCQVPIEFKVLLEDENFIDDVEFTPSEGIVDVFKNEMILVTLRCRECKKVNTNFKITMWGSDQYSLTKYLKYNCVCPDLTCHPPNIKIKFCFLNFEYKRTIKLQNNCDVPGLVTYTPKKDSADKSITCSLSQSEFMMAPHGYETVELSILTKELGLSSLPLIFTVAGVESQELCNIVVDGQGPVISYRPEEVNFNEITPLKPSEQKLVFINDSPIPAFLELAKTPSEGFFELVETEVAIMPDEEKAVTLSAYVMDVGEYSGIISVHIITGETIEISVRGVGVGHSLLCEPNLESDYEFKTHLTHQKFVMPVTITNMGRRYYKVRMTAEKNIRLLKENLGVAKPEYVFSITPEYFELAHMQSQVFEIKGLSKEPRHVAEEFFCYAVVDKSPKIDLVFSFKIKGDFKEPSLCIEKPKLDFLLVEDGDDDIEIEDELSLTNDLDVPMAFNVVTSSDYFIVSDNNNKSQLTQEVKAAGRFSVKIRFAPKIGERRYFKKRGELQIGYANHPHSIKLQLSTEVCFPTISLSRKALEFTCVPLNSYAYDTVIIKNITRLEARYTWEILEESFEIENLPAQRALSLSSLDEISDNLEDLNAKAEGDKKISVATETQTSISFDATDDMKKILFPTIQKFGNYAYDQNLLPDIKDNSPYDEYHVRNILTIEPYTGHLEPFEYIITTIGFFPPPNTKVHAKIICKVKGGEHETLVINGLSSTIRYEFDKEYVEFGMQLFCETCETEITLRNIGYAEFKLTVTSDLPLSRTALMAGWLNVIPNSRNLLPDESVTFKIKYFPGVVGEFHRTLPFMIGHLKPVIVDVHGYAVCSQFFAYVPRPSINDQPLELPYTAIATLSDHYLQCLEKTESIDNLSHDYDEVTQSLPKVDDTWVVITKNDVYPSVTDVDMSIERILLLEHVLLKPAKLNAHTVSRNMKTIPGFHIPPYLLDFGYVVLGTSVCYTVLLLNYGPVDAHVKLFKSAFSFEKKQFKIEYTPETVPVGQTIPIYVLFQPTSREYQEPDTPVMDCFNLAINHGGTIPVEVKAIVTVPGLSLEHDFIKFGYVNVGLCVRRSIVLTNSGYVPTKWSVECKSKQNIYFVCPNEGELEAHRKCLLDIYFLPKQNKCYVGRINIYSEQNPINLSIKLTGYGVMNSLAFNSTNLTFNTVLPYSKDNYMFLSIQNVSDFPIEFCFAEFDLQYMQEKALIDAYFISHIKQYVFIPQRKAGDKLHPMFEENYHMYLNQLRTKLINERLEEDEENEEFEEESEERTFSSDFVDPLTTYSSAVILDMLNELLERNAVISDSTSTDIPHKNDMVYATTIIEPEVVKPEEKKLSGIFIVFHGGPNTEYFKAATRAGEKLNMPVYSIDKLIYESLLENNEHIHYRVIQMINKAFMHVASPEDLTPDPDEDGYDILMRKVYSILYKKKQIPQKGAKGKGAGEKEKKSHSKSEEKDTSGDTPKSGKKGKGAHASSTLADIPYEWFEDILKFKLKSFTTGLIIESLHSDFIRKINMALTALLNATGNLRYFHVIILSQTLENHVKNEEEKHLQFTASQKTVSEKKLPNTKDTESKESDTSKLSKKSKKVEKGDLRKVIMKKIPKEQIEAYEIFQEFLNVLFEICQYWEKKPQLRRRRSTFKSEESELKMDHKEFHSERKSKSFEELFLEDLGVYLWVINNASDSRAIDFTAIICKALEESPDLERARQFMEETFDENKKESCETFTVLTKPAETDSNTSDFFIITNFDSEKKSQEPIKSNKPSRSRVNLPSRGFSKRKINNTGIKGFSNKSKDLETFSNVTVETDTDSGPFIVRQTIEPGDVVSYKINFQPNQCGEYIHKFTVYIPGMNSNQLITCSALCQLPQIDLNPSVMFPNVLKSYRNKSICENVVYIKDTNVLDFGLVFYDAEKPRSYECKLLIRNISRIPCEISASLSEDDSPYFLTTVLTTVLPKQEMYLPVFIKATTAGFLKSELCISVKNNPISHIIKLVTKPCKIDVLVKPKLLNFENVPVNCSLKRKITISNFSPVNLEWRFNKFFWATEIFKISKTKGLVGPYSVFNITISYSPNKVQSIPKKQLVIQVFDPHFSMENPVFTENITLQADSFKNDIDYCDHFDFGEVLGGKEYKTPFTILNKGLHNVCIKLVKIDIPPDKDIKVRKFFNINEATETLHPQKPYKGTFIFTPTNAITFKEVPIFAFYQVECGHVDNGIMDTFVVKASAKVFLSSFVINVGDCLNFGYLQIFTTKKDFIELKNTGKFPFTYKIDCVQQLDGGNKNLNGSDKRKKRSKEKGSKKTGSSKKDSKKKGSSKKDSSKKSSSKKSKGSNKTKKEKAVPIPILRVKCFTIQPSTGAVLPNETAIIEIECRPDKNTEYNETITLNVSNAHKSDVKGRDIMLKVIGTEPMLNFEDFKQIFREQFIIDKLENFKCPGIVDSVALVIALILLVYHTLLPALSTLIFLKPFDRLDHGLLMRKLSNLGLTTEFLKLLEQLQCLRVTTELTSPVTLKSLYKITGLPLIELLPNESKDYIWSIYAINEVPLAFKIGNHCIYESSEKILHFKNVCINTTAATNIYLQNVTYVPANVTVKIEEGKDVFKASASKNINPFCTKPLSIIFKPDSVGERRGRIEITCNRAVSQKFSLELRGQSFIPKVAVIEPPVEDNNQCSIKFVPTYVGHEQYRTISIKNVCPLFSKAIIEICNNTSEMFELRTCEDSRKLLNVSEIKDFQITKYSTLVNLEPNQTANFDLVFSPSNEVTVEALLKVHTVNNPFEIVKITVSAQSYYRDICVERLPPYLLENQNVMGFLIDLGFSYVNYLRKYVFALKNNSKHCIYKFEFDDFEELIFTPKMGHLKPLASKEIIVAYCSRKPRAFQKELIPCTINRIEYTDPIEQIISWDERQTLLTLDTSLKSVSKDEIFNQSDESSARCSQTPKTDRRSDRPEPDFVAVAKASELIPFFFSITVDYCTYVNEVREVSFPDICIKKESTANIDVANNGVVPLEIEWNLTSTDINPVSCQGNSDFNASKNVLDSPSTDISSISSCTAHLNKDEPVFPFSISPAKTSIAPKTTVTFLICFSPDKAMDYIVYLHSNIICLKPKVKNIKIKLKGRGLLPLYYFEIDKSDYLSRRPDGVIKCGGAQTANFKDLHIVEFESVGMAVPCIRKFNVVNPTNEIFSYKWTSLAEYPQLSYFTCPTLSGFVPERKKSEIKFIFKPEEFGNFEEYYTFEILETTVNIPFLLAGTCRQPRVYLTKSHIEMGPTILTVESSTTVLLKNEEDVELLFKFPREHLFCEQQQQELIVSPKRGKLEPKSEHTIKFTFKAEKPGNVNFCTKCIVENIPNPLNLNIFVKCVEVQSVITYCRKIDTAVVTLDTNNENIIDLGLIIPNKKEMITFTISNGGVTGFFYTVHYNAKPIEHLFSIEVNHKKKFLTSKKKCSLIMYLKAYQKATLKNFKVEIKISYGPTYLLNVKAQAETPSVKFSFTSHNFGFCIVQKRKSSFYNVSLEVKNVGSKVLLLENCFKDSNDLTVSFKSAQIQPNSSVHIPMYFHPMLEGHHKITVPFKMYSLKYTVSVEGEAERINFQLLNESDKFIDLGDVMVGTLKQYVVEVLNQTSTYIRAFFDFWDRLPGYCGVEEKLGSEIKLPIIPEPVLDIPKKTKKEKRSAKGSKKSSESSKKDKKPKKAAKKNKGSKSDKSSKSKGKKKKGADKMEVKETESEPKLITQPQKKTATDFIIITPRKYIEIGPNKTHQFVINFKPTEPLAPFSEQIFYEIQDYIEPLCVIKGSSVAPIFVLSETDLNFPNVVVGLDYKKTILLRNIGSFQGRYRFEWIFNRGNQVFNISPISGYVGPSSDAQICVSFEPKVADCVYNTKATCQIEGLESRLELILVANSTNIPSPTSTLYFSCPVRESTTKNIKVGQLIQNKEIIRPVISNQHFYVQQKIKIDPETDSDFILDVTYKPRSMTVLAPHNATLFLPMPEGKAIIYELIGQTLPPLPVRKMNIEFKSKQIFSVMLQVTNWLNVRQCLRVTTELTSPVTLKSLYKITGLPLIELLPNESKDYIWSIYAINEVPLAFKVVFTNVETNEYLYYEIEATVLPGVPVAAQVILTCVRIPVEFVIKLENPIDVPVTFTVDCDVQNLTFDKTVMIHPYSKHNLIIRYCPLKTEEITTVLTAACPELGKFSYSLNLTSKPPPPESTVRFTAQLGEKVYRCVFWKNTFKGTVEFNGKFDHNVFSMDKVPAVPEGETVRIKFSFEPNELGTIQSKGIVSSSLTGSFIYPLIGECNYPTPKGPYLVKPGGFTSISFLNPFASDETFTYELDSDIFFLKTNSEVIKSKKTTKITVNMQSLKYLNQSVDLCPITAKLLVYVADNEENIKWVFYIKSDM